MSVLYIDMSILIVMVGGDKLPCSMKLWLFSKALMIDKVMLIVKGCCLGNVYRCVFSGLMLLKVRCFVMGLIRDGVLFRLIETSYIVASLPPRLCVELMSDLATYWL